MKYSMSYSQSVSIVMTLAILPNLFGCSEQEKAPAAPNAETPEITYTIPKKPYKMLSDYGLFEDIQRQLPGKGVVPYRLNNENFADYATVRRFVRIPPDQSAQYRRSGVFDFPEHTILVQTLSYPRDARDSSQGERRVETRLLIRREEGWQPVPYIWNEEGTDAKKSVAGGLIDVSWIHSDGELRDLKYIVPNTNDCNRCHEDNYGESVPIGMTSWNLNTKIETDNGKSYQLDEWARRGFLAGHSGSADDLARLPGWDDPASGSVHDRARAWLEVNCAFCHSPDGHGSVSGLDLRFQQSDPVRFGVFKPPVAAGRGSEGLRFSIYPGRPDESFIIRRLLSIDPAVMMPPTGRRTSSLEAVELIRAWIAEMHIDEHEAEELIAVQQKNYESMVEQGVWEEEEE